MTISSETSKISYSGNGSTDTFAYTFRILDEDHLLVQKKVTATGVITDLVLTTDYTVTGVGESSGGNIVLVDPATDAPSGSTIIISRDVSRTQETDYTEYDTFPASSHEDALDKLTMIAQQLYEISSRCLKVDIGTSNFSVDLDDVENSGGYYLKINDDGDGISLAPLTDIGTYSFAAGTGLLAQTATGSATPRTLTGTSNEIIVTNGNGLSGNPTLSLPSSLTFTGKTITGGTYSSPTISSPTASNAAMSGTWTGAPTFSGDVTFSGTPAFASATFSGTIGLTGAFSNGSLRVLDTDASHALKIVPGSNLTAERTLTVTTGDSNRTLTMSGDATISGTNNGDQNVFTTIAVSGQSNIVSDQASDTLTIAAGAGITLTTDASTDTLTITNSASSGDWVKISSTNASSSSSITFSSLSATYRAYKIICSGVVNSTALGVYLTLSGSGSTAYTYAGTLVTAPATTAVVGSDSASQIVLSGAEASNGWDAEITIKSHSNVSRVTTIQSVLTNPGGSHQTLQTTGGAAGTAGADTSVTISTSTGNFSSGNFTLYGLVA